MRTLQRDDFHFHLIKQISDESFDGLERPSELTLRYQYDNCELFVWSSTGYDLAAFAMVVSEFSGGPYIWSIATKKDLRGRGFATGLLKEIITFYTEKHEELIDLTVSTDNPAQKLYFDHGFRVVRVIPRYYGATSGLRMRRSL